MRIETITKDNWEDFLAADSAVLILATTTCENCARWSVELEAAFVEEDFFPTTRFGKLFLDQPGLIAFKKANPWIAEVEDLPYNVIYARGEQTKKWAGGGIDRLRNRLNRVLGG